MSSSQKKVIVRLLPGDIIQGYLPASGFVHQGQISYLNLHGRLTTVPLSAIKMISYVRDFNLSDLRNPERLYRRSFISRPRMNGLWVRITFREGADSLEGTASVDSSLLDGFVQDAGVYIVPPDARANTQRVYVPRAAMENFEILALITLRPKPSKVSGSMSEPASGLIQTPLFEDAPASSDVRGVHAKR